MRNALLGAVAVTLGWAAAGCTITSTGGGGGVYPMAGNGSLKAPEGYGLVWRHGVQVDPQQNVRVYLKKSLTLATVDEVENSTNVKAVTRMTDYKSVYEADRPCVSPDGQTVLYQLLEQEREGEESINLWTMSSVTGLERLRNTEGRFLNFYGCFSKSGDKVIFTSNRQSDEQGHLWEIRATGGGGAYRRITHSQETDMWPHEDPSKEGRPIIAFTRFSKGGSRGTIWIYNRQTYLCTQLREGRQPQISPDGAKIVYSAFDEKEGHWNIWVMDIDGSHPTQLTSNDADNVTPSWHPSGKWIIFASNKGAVTVKLRGASQEVKLNNFDIWMMKVNGEHVSQLTVNGSDDDNPAFSPDGKTFYFSSNRAHAVDNLAPEELSKFRARKDVTTEGGIELPIGTGRDIWRAQVADEVLREDVGR